MEKVTYFIVLFIFLAGCDHSERPIDTDIGEIIVNPFERLSESNRDFMLHCSTVDIYPCSNYMIAVNSQRKEKDISVDFLGTYEPDICLTALGPATCKMNFGMLPIGTYTISINKHGQKNTGRLTVDDKKYSLELDTKNGIQIEHEMVYKIPERAIWGYIGYIQNDDMVWINHFIDDLKKLGAEELCLEKGYYSYFTVDETGNIIAPENKGFQYIKTLLFRLNDSNTENVDRLVEQYKQQYGTSGISIYNWKNGAPYYF